MRRQPLFHSDVVPQAVSTERRAFLRLGIGLALGGVLGGASACSVSTSQQEAPSPQQIKEFGEAEAKRAELEATLQSVKN